MEINWQLLMPYLVIIVTFIVVLIYDMIDSLSKWGLAWLTILGSLVASVVSVNMLTTGLVSTTEFSGMIRIDQYSVFFNLIFFVSLILVSLISISYLGSQDPRQGQYYLLMLLSTFGMMLMAGANDLVMVFLGLELMSLPLYVLAGYFRTNSYSSEAGMKYLLLGAFSSCFFLYGIALIYGGTGTTELTEIASSQLTNNMLVVVGMFLLIVGFGFKVGLVPFHQWAPDVYDGAPTSVAAFIATGPKAAGFAAFFRVFIESFSGLENEWTIAITILAVLTMTVGNLAAIAQRNIKRMLAYSSIAHAGYVLVALAAGSQDGTSSAMFYLLVYCIMNVGAFGAIILARTDDGDTVEIADYAGLGFRNPVLAIFMSVMMFSLAGFPPTAGFVSKFYVFRSAVESGRTWLVIIAAINTAVSAYYYLRVVVTLYMKERRVELKVLPYPGHLVIALIVATAGVLLVGVLPSQILNPVQEAIKSSMMLSAMR
ncbi:TPA: NADH-quinone oxidoreductase subunit N [Candidatus Poribacteria bacterium]|jgi:NADH-quinone oxidoreductase subunit N|nr:NADH-quinone oxidoreductase subunit N [Candidatus Poribacteria bacterium]HIN29754.1 NADH-quinone oxidoreductase subunit N [Candidatus Poribacteria bacterium]HIO08187.1 NADH-quinone oxidoreductase subunit N [Candidatus Poribacteria bacterium]